MYIYININIYTNAMGRWQVKQKGHVKAGATDLDTKLLVN